MNMLHCTEIILGILDICSLIWLLIFLFGDVYRPPYQKYCFESLFGFPYIAFKTTRTYLFIYFLFIACFPPPPTRKLALLKSSCFVHSYVSNV